VVFYAFTLFIEPMAGELGWSKPQLTAAFSLGLVAWGLGAVPVGRLIDLGHGRLVMTAGSLAAAALLALWSRVESYSAFVALWIGLGATMSAVLYEPAFAVLTRRLGPLARRGITAMTLVGGLASTAFIPITHVLIERFGWRDALLVLAALNLLVCAVIHLAVIPRGDAPAETAPAATGGPPPPSARRVLRHPAFWGFVLTSILHGALFTGFSVHLIPLLVERGYTLEAAVAAFALIGPAQVAARVVIAAGERTMTMAVTGLIAMALPVLAFALLPLLPPGSWFVALFAALYGASNGMMTIVRAVLPAEIFGREDYGAIQGMISMPSTFSKAAGPFAFGALWAWSGGYGAVMAVGLATAIAMLAAYMLLVLPSRS
jgi:MFS family permease